MLVICSAYLIPPIFVPILKLSLLFLLDIEEVRSRWFTEAAVALTEKGNIPGPAADVKVEISYNPLPSSSYVGVRLIS